MTGSGPSLDIAACAPDPPGLRREADLQWTAPISYALKVHPGIQMNWCFGLYLRDA